MSENKKIKPYIFQLVKVQQSSPEFESSQRMNLYGKSDQKDFAVDRISLVNKYQEERCDVALFPWHLLTIYKSIFKEKLSNQKEFVVDRIFLVNKYQEVRCDVVLFSLTFIN